MEMIKPQNCPKYASCSCNKCSLDPLFNMRSYDPTDPPCKYKKVEFLTIRAEPYQAKTIKVIIPINNDKGLDSKIIEHFGRAEYFLFVTIKNKKIISLYTKKNFFINEKIRAGLSVSREIVKEKIDIALTKEIGEISFYALRDNLVDIYSIQEGNVKKVINNFINGKLKKLDKPTHLSNK